MEGAYADAPSCHDSKDYRLAHSKGRHCCHRNRIIRRLQLLHFRPKDYPGKSEFQAVDDLLTSKSEGVAHGDSEETKQAAATFGTSMKTIQAAFFSGGSGRSV